MHDNGMQRNGKGISVCCTNGKGIVKGKENKYMKVKGTR